MPYIPTEERREVLRAEPFLARTEGEVNFVFSTLMIKIFRPAKSYKTINLLRKIVNVPSTQPEFENMFYQIPRNGSGLEAGDVRAALDNAWSEFYDRVGRRYEDKAIKKNGDIYAELLEEIDNATETKPSVPTSSTSTSHRS